MASNEPFVYAWETRTFISFLFVYFEFLCSNQTIINRWQVWPFQMSLLPLKAPHAEFKRTVAISFPLQGEIVTYFISSFAILQRAKNVPKRKKAISSKAQTRGDFHFKRTNQQCLRMSFGDNRRYFSESLLARK